MEEKNEILTNNDIMNLCLDFYRIGRSNQPFLNAKHLRDAIKKSIERYIEFRKKNTIRS
jgi:hypothetical protein